jgi:hypothetical protein
MWVQSSHVTWHMTTLDTQTLQEEKIPSLGLTDEDIDLLRVVDCDILALGMVMIS